MPHIRLVEYSDWDRELLFSNWVEKETPVQKVEKLISYNLYQALHYQYSIEEVEEFIEENLKSPTIE